MASFSRKPNRCWFLPKPFTVNNHRRAELSVADFCVRPYQYAEQIEQSMPTYEYHCTKCDHEFELSQPITDKSLTTCPKELCRVKPWGKGKVKKKISAGAGLIFKGSGFYITDYRSDNYKEGAKKESGGDKPSKPAETKAGDSGSKETKPAKAKAEA